MIARAHTYITVTLPDTLQYMYQYKGNKKIKMMKYTTTRMKRKVRNVTAIMTTMTTRKMKL